jgi:osmotically-inducible protein OsmY
MPQNLRLEDGHDLCDLVRSTIANNPYLGRHLRVDVHERDVILRGAVRSWYHKQIAQESLRRIHGIGAIHNKLEVVGT